MEAKSRSTGHNEYYESIDGNPLRCPVAYCTYYHGYLSENIIRVHRCRKKHGGPCSRLQNMKGESVKQMRQEQYYDKMLSRLEKIETALNRISKVLGAMQQANEMTPLDKALKEAQSMTAEEYLFGKAHKYTDDEKE